MAQPAVPLPLVRVADAEMTDRTSHHIAVVISDLASGGAQRMLKNLTDDLVSEGLRVCVVTLAPAAEDFFDLDARVDRVTLDVVGKSSTFWSAVKRNIRRAIRLRQALIDSGAPTVLSLVGTTNVLTILATLGLDVRVVISERNDPARQSLGRVWDLLRYLTYRHADLVTAIAQRNLDEMARYVPASKLRVAPMLLVEPQAGSPTKREHPTVLNIGRLTHQKAHDVLLRSFAVVHAHFPEWQLCVIGVGPRREELQALARTLGVADKVDFVGLVQDPYPYLRAAEIFAFPSRFEGVGNALLEAMSCGLPVVVTDASPGPLEYVVDGHSGLVVPTDDEDALASALTRLMSDRDLRDRLGATARETVHHMERGAAIRTWKEILGIESNPGGRPAG